MAKWKIEDKTEGEHLDFWLRRNGRLVGNIDGVVRVPASGPKYFNIQGFGIVSIYLRPRYQQEYMKAHKGVKMGEALGRKLLDALREKGVSYINPVTIAPRGLRFIERGIGAGIIQKAPDEEYLKINWEKVPATEEEWLRMIRRIRVREAKEKRAAKIKRAREWVRGLFQRRPK